MKTTLVKTLVIVAALAGAVQAHADIGMPYGWRISTNGWHGGINANGIASNGVMKSLDVRHDLNPGLPIGTSPDVRIDPTGPLPSLRDLASHPLAR